MVVKKVTGSTRAAPENTSTPRKAATATKTRAPVKKTTTKLMAKPSVGGGLAPSRKTTLAELKEFPGNARIGDVDTIADSLKTTGQYKPIIVQASTNYVIAGNHTLKAALKLGWKTIDALYLDVDDNTATRINLVDNRSNDRATYDTMSLADQLRKIDGYTGTGYTDIDVQGILAAIEERNAEMISEVLRPAPSINFEGAPESEEDQITQWQKQYEDKEFDVTDKRSAEDTNRDTQIALIQHDLEGTKDALFPFENYWGIPTLRRDMLLDTLPDPIDTWAGKDVTPDDGKTTWVWNFGLASSTDMPWDRAIMAGFTYDTKFQALYDDPEFQFARLLHNGLKMSIVPDFSLYVDEPRFFQLQAVYRAQWVGRYMQEIGIKVIPRILWCDPESMNYALTGVPEKAPILATCYQNAEASYYDDPMVAESLRNVIRKLQPEALLVYCGHPGRRVVERALLPKSLHVVIVDNYAHKRRGVAFDKKEGKNNIQVKKRMKLDLHPDE